MEKELRVYVVGSADRNLIHSVFSKHGMSGYLIEEWDLLLGDDEPLPEDAKMFIKIAEKNGNVYSISGFMTAFNIDESIGMSDYIFITNKY